MNEEDRLKGFLDSLSRLSRRYGITVGACGCMGSPWLSKDGKVLALGMTWDKPAGKYRTEER